MKTTWYLIGYKDNEKYLSEVKVSNKVTQATWQTISPTDDINKAIKYTDKMYASLLVSFLNKDKEDFVVIEAEEDDSTRNKHKSSSGD